MCYIHIKFARTRTLALAHCDILTLLERSASQVPAFYALLFWSECSTDHLIVLVFVIVARASRQHSVSLRGTATASSRVARDPDGHHRRARRHRQQRARAPRPEAPLVRQAGHHPRSLRAQGDHPGHVRARSPPIPLPSRQLELRIPISFH